MRTAAFSFILGAASAIILPQQRVLQEQDGTARIVGSEAASLKLPDLSNALHKLKGEVGHITAETQELWDEIARSFPAEIEQLTTPMPPKRSVRRKDSDWNFITRGSHVIAEAAAQEASHAFLQDYNLRTKKVDPASLGADDVKQLSGYLDDEENDKHLFYWFFESRNDPKNDPVVLWLNGGPGCSSLAGMLMELGPSWVNKSIELDHNKFSWNSNASVIFLDQPVNVGYSYSGSDVSNTVAAGKDVYALLSLFFKQFPEYSKQDFHIAGESYAGHYIPVFASEILSHKDRNINLKSILIGNGLSDGLTQYAYYRPMACGDGGYPAVLSESECQSMDNALPRCQSLIQKCYDTDSAFACVPAAIYCNNQLLAPYQRTGQNVYDVRGPCEDTSNLCYPQMGWISEYLNKKNVMEALGAEVSSYDTCNFDINRNFLFAGDWMKPYYRKVPGILEQIPVLIYAGDADFICNWLGNQAWLEALEWPGKKAYNNAELKKWSFGGEDAGIIKSSGNLTFLTVYEAGHMAPFNQPKASLKMLNHWISGKWTKTNVGEHTDL